ncbi:MAG: alpha-L-fucosidase [Verrucomicrobiota bacterium]
MTAALSSIGLAVAEPFEPTWESLSAYQCPEWFQDAKFGIYAHWGPYSAAEGVTNTDWYSRNLYIEGHRANQFHTETYGPVDKFGYKDLIPRFTAEKFDADEWVDLYVEAGARFAGPVGEHADGFAMWDSQVNPWNSAKMGPKRDIVAEMEKAVRKRGLKFMVSMHHQWLWGWYPTWDQNTDAADPANSGLYGEKLPSSAWGEPRPNNPNADVQVVTPRPSKAFNDTWLAKVREVVDGYKPDLLWFDNRMQILPERTRTGMAAYYYNRAAEWEIEPVLTYKRPDMVYGTATVDLERSRKPDLFPEPWLTDTSVSASSWAYARDITYYSVNRMVDDLIDIVSKNGCMLLNIAPHPDGTIPEEQKQRLRGIGKWLKLNGEAIYGTRQWVMFGEGPTVTPVGHLSDVKFEGFGEGDIRFTSKGDKLYAIALEWPKSGTLEVEHLGRKHLPDVITKVRLIGHEGKLKWKQEKDSLVVELPAEKPCDHAFVFEVTRQ